MSEVQTWFLVAQMIAAGVGIHAPRAGWLVLLIGLAVTVFVHVPLQQTQPLAVQAKQ